VGDAALIGGQTVNGSTFGIAIKSAIGVEERDPFSLNATQLRLALFRDSSK
jgi:hypothetical protein